MFCVHAEVCKLYELKIKSHQASILYIMYEVDDLFDLKRARMKREEAAKYYVENVMS